MSMSQTFTGWVRVPGFAWQRAVEAATENATWQLLLAYQVPTKNSERVVLPSDKDPNERPRRSASCSAGRSTREPQR